ncbi:hypothetical protein [Pseudalkalibacillus decolorationis]|uniref:hypothetical protein n=1 Tax=Pseudalkalibacillus decolorationis TaxID=163879 RepID=UPI0021472AF3|nr:hypothetical protein [Pseudalkalibacillus decolorationis]
MGIKFNLGKSERKTRSDKKIRVNPSLDQETHEKLDRLSIACHIPKTQLAYEIIKIAVNNPSLIEYLQHKHNTYKYTRVVPIVHDGEVFYQD